MKGCFLKNTRKSNFGGYLLANRKAVIIAKTGLFGKVGNFILQLLPMLADIQSLYFFFFTHPEGHDHVGDLKQEEGAAENKDR